MLLDKQLSLPARLKKNVRRFKKSLFHYEHHSDEVKLNNRLEGADREETEAAVQVTQVWLRTINCQSKLPLR